MKDELNGKGAILVIIVLGIIALEGLALTQGVDGIALSSSMAALGGIGGFIVKSLIKKK